MPHESWCLWRPEKGAGFPEAGDKGDCELPELGAKN